MKIILYISLIIIVIILFYYYCYGNNNEGFATDAYYQPIVKNERNEDPHIYLKKKLNFVNDKVKEHNSDGTILDNVMEFNMDHSNKNLVKYKHDTLDPNVHSYVDQYMPNELDNKNKKIIYINTKYDKQYYMDRRYMESVIPVEFAKNEQKYCTNHYESYPCRKMNLK